MMNNVKYLSFALILAFSACKSGSASSQEPSEKQDTVKIFNLPQIPVVLNTVEQRTDYMVKHYWDRTDIYRPVPQRNEASSGSSPPG